MNRSMKDEAGALWVRDEGWIRSWLLAALVLILGGLLAACAVPGASPVDQPGNTAGERVGTRLEPPKELDDFTLTSDTGAPLSLHDLRGRPALLFFGYTNCPDICPTTMFEWKKIKGQLGADAGKVAFVFVSVDGDRDTPEVVRQYVHGFDPDFIGLTGDEASIQRVAKDFGVYFNHHGDAASDPKHLIDHGSYSFLLNHDGKLHTVYSYGVPADVIRADVRRVLREDV